MDVALPPRPHPPTSPPRVSGPRECQLLTAGVGEPPGDGRHHRGGAFLGAKLEEIDVLSIGTTSTPFNIAEHAGSGIAQWNAGLVE